MIKRFGPKTITLADIENSSLYTENIINKYHMSAKLSDQEQHSQNPELKEITETQDHILMTLGTSGLQFLKNVEREDYLPFSEFLEAYALCDGFGKHSKEELEEINGGYDWSHIRDSSDEALHEAVTLIRHKLITLYNQK